MLKNTVAISNCKTYDYEDVNTCLTEMFKNLGMNPQNPFEELVKPSNTVFIKPNWVASKWRKSCNHTDTIYSVITHPTIIEIIADKVSLALKGKGKIIIGDNPSIDADFVELMDFTGIKKLEAKYDIPCEILDLRPLVCDDLKKYGKLHEMVQQKGDPRGGMEVNLGKESLLYGIDPLLFRGIFDEREETIKSHTEETHLYTYSKSIYDSDVYISIPKLKTHHKTGVTLNLKGQVGSILNKNQLVHWKVGYPEKNGDEYPSKSAYEESLRSKITNRGAWPGNDTIWRMVSDLYKGLLKKDRNYFSIIDGIIAGEGQGPFCPDSVNSETLIAGSDFLITDIIATRYMGIDPMKIKYLNYFIEYFNINLNEISVINNGIKADSFFGNQKYLNFKVKDVWNEIKIK